MRVLFFLIAVALQAGGDRPDGTSVDASVTPARESRPDPEADRALVAEPQEPTGRFTTATEVRPILRATRGNWVALREYGGQDLLYFTHLLAWRCGLVRLRYAVNGASPAVFPLPPCHAAEAQPNALKPEDGLPYVTYPPGAVQRVDVTIVYDDLTEDQISVERAGVLIP